MDAVPIIRTAHNNSNHKPPDSQAPAIQMSPDPVGLRTNIHRGRSVPLAFPGVLLPVTWGVLFSLLTIDIFIIWQMPVTLQWHTQESHIRLEV